MRARAGALAGRECSRGSCSLLPQWLRPLPRRTEAVFRAQAGRVERSDATWFGMKSPQGLWPVDPVDRNALVATTLCQKKLSDTLTLF